MQFIFIAHGRIPSLFPENLDRQWFYPYTLLQKKKPMIGKKSPNRPDPGARRPQRLCSLGWKCAKQEQAQGEALGPIQKQTGGGAPSGGRTNKQAGGGLQARPRSEADRCTPQTHQVRMPRQEPDTAFHAPTGITAQRSSKVEEERDNTIMVAATGVRPEGIVASNTASAGSNPEHRCRGPRKEVIPETGKHQ